MIIKIKNITNMNKRAKPLRWTDKQTKENILAYSASLNNSRIITDIGMDGWN